MSRLTFDFRIFTVTREEADGAEPHTYAYVPACIEEPDDVAAPYWIMDRLEVNHLHRFDVPDEGETANGFQVVADVYTEDIIEIRGPDGEAIFSAEETADESDQNDTEEA